MHWGAISTLEKIVKDTRHPNILWHLDNQTIIIQLLDKTLEGCPPEVLMQHLGAGGHEDAMWMRLYEYLDKHSVRKCFLTRRGDADVFWKVRETRLVEMRELLRGCVD